MSPRSSSEIGRVRSERLDANTSRLHGRPCRYGKSVDHYASDCLANRHTGPVARNGADATQSGARSTVKPGAGGGHGHAIARHGA